MSAGAPLRLLCVSHYFEGHRGGIEMVAGQLGRGLAALGVQVQWAATDASEQPSDLASVSLPASNIVERRCGLPFPVLGLRGLSRLFGAIGRADAVLVHDGMYMTSVAAAVCAWLLRRPFVLVQHIGYVPAESAGLRLLFWFADRCVTRPMLRAASQVVFVSGTSARHFGNTPTRRPAQIIFNGVDTSTFKLDLTGRSQTRRDLAWPLERPVALFVGRFLEKKGLLRPREMAKARPDIHWAFAGWGPCDPSAWGLTNVSVHQGLSGFGLAALYQSADLLILSSKSEGFPLVVQEALACGLRPICCEDGARADPAAAAMVESIPNSGNENAIVAAYLDSIDRLIDGDSEAQRGARAAFAKQHYSWTTTITRYRAMLEKLCSKSAAIMSAKEQAA